MRRSSRTVAVAAIIAMSAGWFASAQAAGQTGSHSGSAEREAVRRLNASRVAAGEDALPVAADLTAAARRHSARMAARGAIYHNPNLGDDVDGWTLIGENVGVGKTIEDIHEAFMASATHRRNIVDERWTQTGVGVVAHDGRLWVTQMFARRAIKATEAPRTAAPALAPAPRPAAPAPAAEERPRTVDVLLRMIDEGIALPILAGQ